MKLVVIIISNKDAENVLNALAVNGFFATKFSTKGQFLIDGHTTILVGCEGERLDSLYSLLKANVTKRVVKTAGVTSTITGSLLNQSVDVEENGCVAFTIDIEDFNKF